LKNLKTLPLGGNPWAEEWKELASTGDIPKVLTLCRKVHGVKVFISHAMKDFQGEERDHLIQFKSKLNEREVIHEVDICEESVGGIVDFMDREVLGSDLLIFIATQNSKVSGPCRHELALAKKYGITILPINGPGITWDELMEIDLELEKQGSIDWSALERLEFQDNIEELNEDVVRYIRDHEAALKASRSKRAAETDRELADLQSAIEDKITKFINSAEFRKELEANFKGFEEIFRAISEGKLTSLNYFSQWSQLLKK